MDMNSSHSAISALHFRQTLGMFATGVTVITTLAPDGTPVGVTMNSFNSVSMEPPLVLWSFALQARSFAVFQQARHCAVNVLSAQQKPLALRFSQRHDDRFEGVAWRAGTAGVPLLDGALASLECRPTQCYPAGDHAIFVAEVLHCQHRSNGAPLLFHGGQFYTELPLP